MSEVKYLTKKGLEKIKNELKFLKSDRRQEITHRISEAIKLGDLSENAEYQEAKDDQGLNEARIRELEEIVKSAVVIDDEDKDKNCVSVGCTIKAKFAGQEKNFTIVGPAEANPSQGIISNESPIGKAFLGKKIGDLVEVEVPAGIIKYKIIAIE
jgi:transcription elongation factor GreA